MYYWSKDSNHQSEEPRHIVTRQGLVTTWTNGDTRRANGSHEHKSMSCERKPDEVHDVPLPRSLEKPGQDLAPAEAQTHDKSMCPSRKIAPVQERSQGKHEHVSACHPKITIRPDATASLMHDTWIVAQPYETDVLDNGQTVSCISAWVCMFRVTSWRTDTVSPSTRTSATATTCYIFKAL